MIEQKKRGPRPKSIESRFWRKVIAKGLDECWLWRGSLTVSGGYGQISRTRKEGPIRANRVVWELFNGPVPKGMCVLHTCDTPSCVNPAHLYLGTRGDNARDMVAKKRWSNGRYCGENHVPFNQHLKGK